jgi:hypothetical protein
MVFTHEGRAAFLSRGKLLMQKRRHVLLHHAELPHQFIALADKSYRCTALGVDCNRDWRGLESEVPTHLFVATSIDAGRKATDTWNMVIPMSERMNP